MRIGIPKEIKNNENRVGIIPAFVSELIHYGHEIFIEEGAGVGSGISDQDFIDSGAKILKTADEIWAQEMVIKVKEPLESEYSYLRSDLLLYTYLHLAAEPKLTEALVKSGCTAIAYETVEKNGALPLLRPMSEVAGRRAVIIGATQLEKHRGGAGMLLSGIPGVDRGVVTIVGGGVAGINAAKMAIGLGAKVNILELNEDRLRYLDDIFGDQIVTLKSNERNIAQCVQQSDLLISTILIPGAKATKIVTESMVKSMKPGSVIVDVSIDQGGSVETIDRITTHDDPVYEKHGVIHYAVANMPGATPRTSTYGLNNATMPYAVQIANKGWRKACQEDAGLSKGLNVINGEVVCKPVADALGYSYIPLNQIL